MNQITDDQILALMRELPPVKSPITKLKCKITWTWIAFRVWLSDMLGHEPRLGYIQCDDPDRIFRTEAEAYAWYDDESVCMVNGDNGYIEQVELLPGDMYMDGKV